MVVATGLPKILGWVLHSSVLETRLGWHRNEGQIHRHVYRKSGSGWAVPALRGWHLLHSHRKSHPAGYVEHKEDCVVSKVSAVEQSRTVSIWRRELQATLSGHSVKYHTDQRKGLPAPWTWPIPRVWGNGVFVHYTYSLRVSSAPHNSSKNKRRKRVSFLYYLA